MRIPRVYQPGWLPLWPIVSAALAAEHHANDERNAPAVAPLDAEEPGEPHLGILAVVAPRRCKPPPNLRVLPGQPHRHGRSRAPKNSPRRTPSSMTVSEAKVFTKPRRPSSWITPRR